MRVVDIVVYFLEHFEENACFWDLRILDAESL